jgi:leucyl aminopeptidase (aminopeptidase T)
MRDPTKMRELYKMKKAALERWHSTFEKMMAGDPEARKQMPAITKQLTLAHDDFTEESQHFVKSGPKM